MIKTYVKKFLKSVSISVSSTDYMITDSTQTKSNSATYLNSRTRVMTGGMANPVEMGLIAASDLIRLSRWFVAGSQLITSSNVRRGNSKAVAGSRPDLQGDFSEDTKRDGKRTRHARETLMR